MLGFMELPGAQWNRWACPTGSDFREVGLRILSVSKASLAAAGCLAGSLACLGAPGTGQPRLVRGEVDGASGHGSSSTFLSRLQMM